VIPYTKNYLNRFIFRRVIQKYRKGTFFETQYTMTETLAPDAETSSRTVLRQRVRFGRNVTSTEHTPSGRTDPDDGQNSSSEASRSPHTDSGIRIFQSTTLRPGLRIVSVPVEDSPSRIIPKSSSPSSTANSPAVTAALT